ncbi:tRNA (uridine(54)-C5)-methyltransferase TrmA [Shewanella dokdonensis]|uniref:tRNA/tmRNA (uracil-C(5))-methyltransferase n=1 Tax=Shewanella dokdonensis TaxID=712036 RepID=A0ABX8DI28_9GAMM|nr:tRNA (uridine(54)-C5)-methyltransferase TrmA [Shewanella dokdonensis]MCL1076238.1 tRNA (uridine(54)-C5)-methyltransferase TrmA [Shewanella dokdonensis]QVK24388.1 tRNA (uridine(54)-C5)-methyltransferase TrmA [Shewanella dokdonensis]
MDIEAMVPERYNEQLEVKRQLLQQSFAEFAPPPLEVFASTPEHYRMRAEFRVWHDGDDLYFCVYDPQNKQPVRCDQFVPASRLINEMMLALVTELKPNPTLRHKLFQVDFLSTMSGEILVSLLYHRQLDSNWQTQALAMKQRLSAQFHVDIIGRARKQKIVLERDFVTEQLEVNGQRYLYKQVENSFTQPNAGVACKMLQWAQDCTRNSKGDLLELYCGNGNFSIALAQNFDKVLATELAKPSVESAQYNIAINKIPNLQIIRMSAEEFSQAVTTDRQFRRLAGIDLSSYHCNTIFVDPPRAGLDQQTVGMVQGYDNILYISCNPETLKNNLEPLCQSHRISRFALFDQFPYTDHIETGVLLERIK